MRKTVFIIRYGYDANNFVLTSSLDEVAKAMYAKVAKLALTIGGKFISGQEIKSIEPDIHSYTGWYRTYEPGHADDYAQIERDVPKELYTLMDGVAKRVSYHITSGNAHKIGNEGLTAALLLGETPEKLEAIPNPAFQIAPKSFN
jgi:hypothetical protein